MCDLYSGVPASALKALQSLAKHPEIASILLAAVSHVTVTPPVCHHYPLPIAATSPAIITQFDITGTRYTNTGGHDLLEGEGL